MYLCCSIFNKIKQRHHVPTESWFQDFTFFISWKPESMYACQKENKCLSFDSTHKKVNLEMKVKMLAFKGFMLQTNKWLTISLSAPVSFCISSVTVASEHSSFLPTSSSGWISSIFWGKSSFCSSVTSIEAICQPGLFWYSKCSFHKANLKFWKLLLSQWHSLNLGYFWKAIPAHHQTLII